MPATTPLAIHIPREFLYLKDAEAIKDSVILKGIINKVIRKEIDQLESELGGCVLPNSVKSEIKGYLKTKEPTRINVVLDADLAERIKTLCKDTNIVRDALFTRIWFYMLGSWGDFGSLSLNAFSSPAESGRSNVLAPIRQVAEILEDPLWFVRDAMADAWNEHCPMGDFPGLYRIDLVKFEASQRDSIITATDKFLVMTTCISEQQHYENKKAIAEGIKKSRELIKNLDMGELKLGIKGP